MQKPIITLLLILMQIHVYSQQSDKVLLYDIIQEVYYHSSTNSEDNVSKLIYAPMVQISHHKESYINSRYTHEISLFNPYGKLEDWQLEIDSIFIEANSMSLFYKDSLRHTMSSGSESNGEHLLKEHYLATPPFRLPISLEERDSLQQVGLAVIRNDSNHLELANDSIVHLYNKHLKLEQHILLNANGSVRQLEVFTYKEEQPHLWVYDQHLQVNKSVLRNCDEKVSLTSYKNIRSFNPSRTAGLSMITDERSSQIEVLRVLGSPEIKIKSSFKTHISAEVYSLNSQLIKEIILRPGMNSLSIDDLSSGIYILRSPSAQFPSQKFTYINSK